MLIFLCLKYELKNILFSIGNKALFDIINILIY